MKATSVTSLSRPLTVVLFVLAIEEPASAQKISNLPSAANLAGTEALPVVQSGETRKATVSQVQAPAVFRSGQSYEYDVTAADDIAAGKPLMKLLPPAVQAAVLSNTNVPDLAPYITLGLANYKSVDLQGIQNIVVKTPIVVSGTAWLNCNGAKIDASMTTATDAVFVSGTSGGYSVSSTLNISRCFISGHHTVFRFRMTPGVDTSTVGLAVKADHMTFQGVDRSADTRVFDMSLVDFSTLRDSTILNYDQAFRFDAMRTNVTVNLTGGSPTVNITAVDQPNMAKVGSYLVCPSGLPSFPSQIVTAQAGGATGSYAINQNALSSQTGITCTVSNPRGNTQNAIENLTVGSVNSLGFIEQTDAFQATALDALNMGSGLVIGQNVSRARFRNFHIEDWGTNGTWKNQADIDAGKAKYGWGIWVTDFISDGTIVFEESSMLSNTSTSSTILGGFHCGTSNGTTKDFQFINSTISATAVNNPTYVPIECRNSGLKWQGLWNFSTLGNMVLGDVLASGSTFDNYTDFVIDEGPTVSTRANESMLAGTKALNLRKSTGSAPTIADDSENIVSRGHLVTFGASGELYDTITLAPGWYTLFTTGYRKSGSFFAYVKTDSAGINRVSQGMNSSNSSRPLHAPFYVPSSEVDRVGFRSVGGASQAVVGTIALFKGFYIGSFVPRGTWSAPPVSALLTCAATNEGDVVTLASTGVVSACTSAGGTSYQWRQVSN